MTTIELIGNLPRITAVINGETFWELFKHEPHSASDSEGWTVLGWMANEDDPTRHTFCAEAYEFGNDLQAALAKFAEVHQRTPKE